MEQSDYQYKPLLPDQIRLIEFQVAQPDLSIKLRHYHDTALPEYHALSYARGSQTNNQSITCDGARLKVTPHFKDGILAIVKQAACTRLWADAICIDQESDDEKASQVAKMHHIYQKATGLYVWLGLGTDGSATAMREIRDLAVPSFAAKPVRTSRELSDEVSTAFRCFLVQACRCSLAESAVPTTLDRSRILLWQGCQVLLRWNCGRRNKAD